MADVRTAPGSVDDPALSHPPELLLRMYARMLLTRALDLRSWTLSRQGKAHFVITGRGHEALQIGSAFALSPGADIVFPYYRDLGVAVGLGMTARAVMLGVLARAADPSSAGRQLPMHFSVPSLKIVSGSSVTGTQIPHAVGAALAIRHRGEDAVAVTYFGEATTSKGDFHEAINFAAIHRLPVVLVCENNGYGISVPARLHMSVESAAKRAEAYGVSARRVDGRDPVAVYEAMVDTVGAVRAGCGPAFLEGVCDRLTPHSSDDNDRLYRSAEELEEQRARDPVPAFGGRLERLGLLDRSAHESMRAEAAEAVDEAVAFAEASPAPEGADALRGVFGAPS